MAMNRNYRLLNLFVILVATCCSFNLQANGFGSFANPASEPEFLEVDDAFRFTAEALDGEVILRWEIAEDYYLYRHRMSVKAESGAFVPVAFPRGTPKVDEYFGDVEIYTQLLEIPVQIADAPEGKVELVVGYQGCTEGLCYPPTKRTVNLSVDTAEVAKTRAGASETTTSSQPSKVEPPNKTTADNAAASTDTSAQNSAETATNTTQRPGTLENTLQDGNILLIFGTFFIIGLGLSLTPCVYPMYPVLSSIIAGQGKNITTFKSTTLAFTYVQGICVAYAVLGITIASLQFNVNSFFQQPMFVVPVILLLVALSLSMFGFYELQMPGFLRDRLNAVSNQQQGGSYFGVFIMGIISTLVLSPCTAAPLITAFGYIATTGDRFIGGLSLYALGLGMGTPLIALGIVGGKALPRAGGWMNAIKAGFGVGILAVALRLADPILPGQIYLVLWSVLLITTALYMGIFHWPSTSNSHTFWKGIGMVLFVYGCILLVGAAMGNGKVTKPLEGLNLAHSTTASPQQQGAGFVSVKSQEELEKTLATAAANNQRVMLDFFAEWCTACFELADYTFPDPKVQAALEGTLLLKMDITESSPENRAVEKAYGILGLPMILFYDEQGQELKDRRVSGFLNAEKFAEHVKITFKD